MTKLELGTPVLTGGYILVCHARSCPLVIRPVLFQLVQQTVARAAFPRSVVQRPPWHRPGGPSKASLSPSGSAARRPIAPCCAPRPACWWSVVVSLVRARVVRRARAIGAPAPGSPAPGSPAPGAPGAPVQLLGAKWSLPRGRRPRRLAPPARAPGRVALAVIVRTSQPDSAPSSMSAVSS